jgi:hypothetical protein
MTLNKAGSSNHRQLGAHLELAAVVVEHEGVVRYELEVKRWRPQ